MSLAHRHILLGVTGGIAAYKACKLARLLTQSSAEVQVVMTRSAEQFVGRMTFEALTRRSVRTDLFDGEAEAAMSHIELARWADAVLIAPASANFMARLAHGLADDLLGTLCLATRAPILVAPAMNTAMWENAATVKHVDTLRTRGIEVLEPASGEQACGEVGPGRLPEPTQLHAALAARFETPALHGLHAVVTAGPTRERLDPARFISNFSSGQMGCAIASALLDAGATVTLIAGPITARPPAAARLISVESAAEMHRVVNVQIEDCQLFIAAAAIADWRPRHPSLTKIRKETSDETLELEPTVDILKSVGARTPRPFTVGFAAETGELIEAARTKLHDKKVDLMVANRISAEEGFGDQDTTLHLVDATGSRQLGPGPKAKLAHQLIAHLTEHLSTASVVEFPHAHRRRSHSG